MIRILCFTLVLLTASMLGGCLDGGGDAASDGPAATFEEQSMEGRFRSAAVGEVQENEGGHHTLQVPTLWRSVHVDLEANIDVFLVLTPPDCPGGEADCTVRFDPDDGDDGSWFLPVMEPGTWDVAVFQDDYSVVEGSYKVTFGYLS